MKEPDNRLPFGQKPVSQENIMKRVCKSAILFAVLSALTLSVYSQSRADQEESYSFQDKTDTAKYTFDVAESMMTARLEVKGKVRSGAVEWYLRDPKGEARLNGHCTGGNITLNTGEMKPLAGVWTLEVVMENATGNYRFTWKAH